LRREVRGTASAEADIARKKVNIVKEKRHRGPKSRRERNFETVARLAEKGGKKHFV